MPENNPTKEAHAQLRAALAALVRWNKRNGGYGELPPLMDAAEAALQLRIECEQDSG